ncbi:protein-L-isoaspartate(D-aspartate) O-methyltransferase [Desulfobotulus sp. H1]|uniref:Protein-L-isoaspartate O-methyltransferase n=1 Tax=Desulfobotulus pelophilus TaxID=2823377 RepID=A0ABT3NBI8_9BACT|nr:protein-L-isoaspartate(D-aspartate) O-methyltransferase [Desulfobotulus pelophilus]MCW7754785.1 protein-L-isoaspartate(D-aspartate) O-methyltransferase [Desulfobotulus pelophilus]
MPSGREPEKFIRWRKAMVTDQLQGRGIRDAAVLAAMGAVPRHLFVSEALMDQAYGDYPLPIGYQQTISQPQIVAEMTQALGLLPGDRVLEIGTGSGYQAAVLAEIVFRVYTIERLQPLYMQARKLFDRLKYHNIVTRYSDGSTGWKPESPFDAVLVTAGGPSVPEVLLSQLAVGGRLVMPVGTAQSQDLLRITRTEEGFEQETLCACRFVKLIGEHGWRDE